MEDPGKVPSLYGALKVNNGGKCHRNLRLLSTLLKKRASTAVGLRFLLKCREYHMFPCFITRSVKFAHLGHHLEWLSEKLPERMLRAAIRDVWARLATIQEDLDSVWVNLYDRILDNALWNALVAHKDDFYYNQLETCTKRLAKKFTGLFA